MKKFVKPLVIAASVAAIAGIGAVSFAAWSGTNTSATPGAEHTATINTLGITATAKHTSGDKLVPYNQVEGMSGSNLTKEFVFELAFEGDDAASKDIQVTYTGTLDSTSKYMVKFDTSATVATNIADTTGYTEIKTAATGTAKYDIQGTETDKKVYAHIILDSTKSADMDQSVTFTFELVAHA